MGAVVVSQRDGTSLEWAEEFAAEDPLCMPRPQCFGAFRLPDAQVCGGENA